MKRYYLLFALIWSVFLFTGSLTAQVKIAENSKDVNPHALLELESTAQGLILPRGFSK